MTACGFCMTSIVPARNSYSASIWRTPYAKGMTSGTALPPDCISFQKNHYELGDHVGRTLFLREYASFISDEMITELMDYPRNMMLSIDIIPVAMDEAVSDIRKRIMSVESDITRCRQRQNQNGNNFTANIPYDLELQCGAKQRNSWTTS